MKVKDLKSVFGISVEELVRHGKRYRILISLLYLFDMICIFGSTAYMFFHEIQYQWYWIMLVIVCVLVNIIADLKFGTNKYLVYCFYMKNSKCEVVQNRYMVDVKDMRQIMYEIGEKPVDDTTIQALEPYVLNACKKNVANSNRFMSKLAQLQSDCGNVVCLVFKRGGKQYFLDFVVDNSQTVKEDKE